MCVAHRRELVMRDVEVECCPVGDALGCGRLWAPSPETEVPTLSSQPIAALARRLARMPETQEFTDIEAHEQTHTHIAGPYDVDGNIRCYKHQLIANLKTSNTERNPERLVYRLYRYMLIQHIEYLLEHVLIREFYACAKEKSDPDRCNFFC